MKIRTLDKKLKITLLKEGYTLTKFASLIDIDTSYLSLIVNGKRTVSPTLARKIVSNLETNFEDIFEIIEKEEA